MEPLQKSVDNKDSVMHPEKQLRVMFVAGQGVLTRPEAVDGPRILGQDLTFVLKTGVDAPELGLKLRAIAVSIHVQAVVLVSCHRMESQL